MEIGSQFISHDLDQRAHARKSYAGLLAARKVKG